MGTKFGTQNWNQKLQFFAEKNAKQCAPKFSPDPPKNTSGYAAISASIGGRCRPPKQILINMFSDFVHGRKQNKARRDLEKACDQTKIATRLVNSFEKQCSHSGPARKMGTVFGPCFGNPDFAGWLLGNLTKSFLNHGVSSHFFRNGVRSTWLRFQIFANVLKNV